VIRQQIVWGLADELLKRGGGAIKIEVMPPYVNISCGQRLVRIRPIESAQMTLITKMTASLDGHAEIEPVPTGKELTPEQQSEFVQFLLEGANK